MQLDLFAACDSTCVLFYPVRCLPISFWRCKQQVTRSSWPRYSVYDVYVNYEFKLSRCAI